MEDAKKEAIWKVAEANAFEHADADEDENENRETEELLNWVKVESIFGIICSLHNHSVVRQKKSRDFAKADPSKMARPKSDSFAIRRC